MVKLGLLLTNNNVMIMKMNYNEIKKDKEPTKPTLKFKPPAQHLSLIKIQPHLLLRAIAQQAHQVIQVSQYNL